MAVLRLWVGMAGLLLAASPHAADEPLEEAMSTAEFRRAGLERLEAAELAYLNAWLGRGGIDPLEQKFGQEQLPAQVTQPAESELRTTIAGRFEGWSGRTVFRLGNGQFWQQRLPGKYGYKAIDPEVVLKRGRFGYYLQVVSSGRQIAVKRLR